MKKDRSEKKVSCLREEESHNSFCFFSLRIFKQSSYRGLAEGRSTTYTQAVNREVIVALLGDTEKKKKVVCV